MTTIKKTILLALTVLVMAGCDEKGLKEITRHAAESFKNEPIPVHGMIVDLDSCQYVVCGGWVYVHHNNCRFCKERRQKELKELVEQLKEK